MIYLQYQFYLVKLKGNCTRSHKQSTLPLTTSRQDEECTINIKTIVHVIHNVHVNTHVHVTKCTCKYNKVIPELIDQPSVQNLQAL